MKSLNCLGAVRTVLSVAVLSALVACGGGGGSDDAADPTVTLSGIAAKGLLKNAIVRAYRVNSDGSQTLIKESVTDTDGSYSLADMPAGVTVLVEISAGPSTTMVDEATNATDVPVPAGFRIRAATTTVEGGTNTLQVTPFSEMAVTKAEGAEGGLLPANIEGANADIRTYLGFDVLAERPDFSDDGTAPENKAALMLAAVSQLANNATEVDNLGCDSGDDTGDRIKCVIEKLAEGGTDDDALADKLETAKDEVVNDDFAGTDDDIPPAPLPQPTEIVAPDVRTTAISEAKALIAGIRANAPYLGGSGTDTLDKRLRAVEQTINAAANPVNATSLDLYQGVLQGAQLLQEGAFMPPGFRISIARAMVSGCTFFSSTDPTVNTEAANADEVNAVGCRMTYNVAQKQDGNWYAYQHGFRVVKTNTAGTYTVYSQVVEQLLNEDMTMNTSSPGNTVRYPQGSSALVGGVVLTSNEGGQITGISMSGEYAAGVRAALQGYATKTTVTASVTPSIVAVGDVELTRLSLTGSFVSSGGSKPAGTVQLASGSYLQTRLGTPGDIHSAEDLGIEHRTANLILSASAGEASVAGTLTIDGFSHTADELPQELPSTIAFQGVVKQDSATTLFDGTVTAESAGYVGFMGEAPVSESNFTSVDLSFEGALYVPSRPIMTVNLTLSSPSFQHYTLNGSYAQSGGSTVLVSGAGQEGVDAETYVNFTTASGGISFRLVPNATVAYLKKNDVVIGTFTQRTSRLDYADGSYEQF